MNSSDIRIVDRRALYEGFFRLEAVDFQFRQHNGTWSPQMCREVFVRGATVAVLPYDPRRDHVVLIEQVRIGAVIAGYPPYLLEVVAGMRSPEESAQACASRETHEETGLDILALEPIFDYLVSPGGSDETISLFCGHVDATNVGGIHGVTHEHEDIKVHSYPIQETQHLLETNRSRNAVTIIALLWLQNHIPQLKHKWRPEQPMTL